MLNVNTIIPHNTIPRELQALEQWVNWGPRKNKQGEIINKMPIDPNTGRNAHSNFPATWGKYQQAIEGLNRIRDVSGIGFMFSESDPYCGIDLDKCRNKETGELESWAARIVSEMNSYTELSPSGTGIHIITKGKLPGDRNRSGKIEMYDKLRYFTMTGNILRGSPATINDKQEALNSLYARTFKEDALPQQAKPAPRPLDFSDRELIAKIEASEQGAKFSRLWRGDTLDHGSDDSAADLALCSILRFWTGGDVGRIDSLFRQSGLMRPKWERPDYRARTIEAACKTQEYYDPEQRARESNSGQGITQEEEQDEIQDDSAVPWPEPMPEAAFYGLAGEVVAAILPHTEAAREAILVNFLIALGAMAGRGPHTTAGNARHGVNLFAVLTGATSGGRKGTSQAAVDGLLRLVDADFMKDKTPGGLSTGEGLIWIVRDPVERPKKCKPGTPSNGEMEIEFAGIDDKRLMVVETELGQTLQVLKREGNTLSAILRQAWDGKECLQALTKAVKGQSTGAHISLIGHVTREELLKNFASVEILNGLGNRILWVCVRKSKDLPEGGRIPDLSGLAERVAAALQFASLGPEVARSPESAQLWANVYPALNAERGGLWGAATARAAANVARISTLYALLDSTDTIRPEHLKAAVAVWQYCENSARFIFGGQESDTVQQKIIENLKAKPLTQTAINGLFGGHVSAGKLREKLEMLSAKGRIVCREEKTDGRALKKWILVR